MSASLLAATVLSALAVPVQVPVQAAGKWTVDFAEDRCLTTREFTAGGRPLTFGFQLPITNPESATFYLLVPASDAPRWKGVRLSVPGAPPTEDYGEGPVQEGTRYLIIRTLPEGAATALPTAARVDLTTADQTMSIPVDTLAKVKPLLADCERDLLVRRGATIEAVRAIAVWPRVVKSVGSFFTADDYPADAIRNAQQGTTSVLLTVTPEGRVSKCRVTTSSRSDLLDFKTCDVLKKRARYVPAKDKDGKSIEGYVATRTVWRIPA